MSVHIRVVLTLSLAVFAVLGGEPTASLAADGSWSADESGNWSAMDNWQGGNVASGSTAWANFTNTISADRTVTNNESPWAIGSIRCGSASFNWTIADGTLIGLTNVVVTANTGTVASVIDGDGALVKSGSGTLTLGGANRVGALSAVAGVLTLQATNTVGPTAGSPNSIPSCYLSYSNATVNGDGAVVNAGTSMVWLEPLGNKVSGTVNADISASGGSSAWTVKTVAMLIRAPYQGSLTLGGTITVSTGRILEIEGCYHPSGNPGNNTSTETINLNGTIDAGTVYLVAANALSGGGGNYIDNANVVLNINSGAQFTATGSFKLGFNGSGDLATLNVTTGGTCHVGGIVLGGGGSATNPKAQSLRVSGGTLVTTAPITDSTTGNNGFLILSGGLLDVRGNGLAASGGITFTGGTLRDPGNMNNVVTQRATTAVSLLQLTNFSSVVSNNYTALGSDAATTATVAVGPGRTLTLAAGKTLTISTNAWLVGAGTVAGTATNFCGTLSPGTGTATMGTNSVGTLTVSNLYFAGAGARFVWECDAATNDVIRATGTVALPAQATVVVRSLGGGGRRGTLLAYQSNVGAVDLSGWTVEGGTVYHDVANSRVEVRLSSRNTVLTIR